jgi:hypothetical protein
MAFDIDYFLKINNTYGATSDKDVQLYNLKSQVNNNFTDTIDFYKVKINDVERDLLIVRTVKQDEKKIKSRPDEAFNIGDTVLLENKSWLVMTKDVCNQAYTTGLMKLTNYTIKFQHPATGEILSYPCITSSTRLGQEENKFMTLGNNQKSITLPYDQITVLLANSVDKTWRFFVDKHPTKPQSYKLVGVDNTSHEELIELIVEEDELQADDRVDLGVCDYWTPPVEPEPVDPEIPTRVVTISSEATNNEVKLGLTYTFTATATNELGEVITETQPRYTIDNTYGGKVVLADKLDGTATIKVNSNAYELLGSQFTLQCMDMISGFYSSILFTIVSMW